MKPKVNNDYYNHLGESWYTSDNDPIAVLRAELKIKNPWIEKRIEEDFLQTTYLSNLKMS